MIYIIYKIYAHLYIYTYIYKTNAYVQIHNIAHEEIMLSLYVEWKAGCVDVLSSSSTFTHLPRPSQSSVWKPYPALDFHLYVDMLRFREKVTCFGVSEQCGWQAKVRNLIFRWKKLKLSDFVLVQSSQAVSDKTTGLKITVVQCHCVH